MKFYKCLFVLIACVYSLPGMAQITVFPECNFLGNAVTLPVGDYTRADLRRMGVSDNDISSIIVAKGYVVSLYAGDGFRGQSGDLSEVAACLADDNFDNKISSLSVREVANTGFDNNTSNNSTFSNVAGGVEVFSECQYRGRSAILEPGEYTAAALAALGMPDNSISSVKVPEGFEISLFANDFNRGQSGKLSGDNECLVDRFNDAVSSVVVSGEMTQKKEPVETGSPLAIVYSECNYRGQAAELRAGDFMAATLEALGMPDNSISSVRLARGVELHLFKNDFMRGISTSIKGDVQCLAGDKFDNNISSIKVIPGDGAAKPPVVELGVHVDIFSECDYRGTAASLPAGEYTSTDLADLGFPDNSVSSIRVPAGYEVTGFEHDFYRGGTVGITNDESCLDSRRADNAISSFKVEGEPTALQAPPALSARERRVLNDGLECVGKYVDRNLCTTDAWGVIRDFCSLDKIALMNDGYLEGHVKNGNCTAKNWKELVRRIADPTVR